MDTKKVLLATLCGAIALFALGYLTYVLLFNDLAFKGTTAAGVARNPVFFPGIIVMEIVFSFLITYIFAKWAGIKTFQTGLMAGGIIGLLVGLGNSLDSHSTTTLLDVSGLVFWTITITIRWAVAGGVIGYILGSGAKD
jgi:hypothetical protein